MRDKRPARRDVIVVGGGPAGLTAGFYLSRAGFDTLLIERGRIGGRAARIPLIHNYPGFPQGIAGRLLAGRMTRQARRWGLRTAKGDVRTIEPTAFGCRFLLKDSSVYRSRAAIVATGTEFLPLDIPGAGALAGRGVHHAVFDDAERYAKLRVGVVGGGETAAHQALALARHAKKVVLFVRGRDLKAIRPLLDATRKHPRIEVRRNAVVRRVLGDDALTGVEWTSTAPGGRVRRERLDALFVLVGQRPHLPSMRGADKRSRAGTIFIAGDARPGAARHVVAAAADGLARAAECERRLRGWS